ncbi:MAG: HK97 family phage prohead protease [Gammaproteobacteria bacterium]|nr:HK97 family phage prohead protease [Gammaproteobacteria bacterium]
METLTREVEFRTEGRRLSGVALPYRVESPSHGEMFLPGSIELADAVPLNLRHNELQAVAYHPGGGLSFDDRADALHMSAEVFPIPAGDVALRDVRAGRLPALSIEFLTDRESRDASGLRVIEKARLVGLALVADPAYPTMVEARRRKAAGRARVRPMPESVRRCGCVGPNCTSVRFTADAFERAVGQAAARERNIVLHTGSYDPGHVIATTAAGSLFLSTGADGAIVAEVSREAMESPAGTALAESVETSAPIVRPLLNDDDSEFTEEGAVRTYTVAAVTSLLVKVSLADATGWEKFEVLRRPRRRRWSWL